MTSGQVLAYAGAIHNSQKLKRGSVIVIRESGGSQYLGQEEELGAYGYLIYFEVSNSECLPKTLQ